MAATGETPATRSAPAEAGQSMVMSILFLGVLLGFCALLIDGGSWMWTKRSMQGDADAAALASVRELTHNPGAAQEMARQYAEDRNAGDFGVLQSFVSDTNRMTTSVTVGRSAGSSPFGQLLGLDSTDIRARATARIAQVSRVDAVLPLAALENTLEFGNPPVPAKITFSPGHGNDEGMQHGHAGAVAPRYTAPSCTGGTTNSATEFERAIEGQHTSGGIVACGTPVGTALDTATGDRPNAVRDGFNDRLGTTNGTHSDTFADVFSYDAQMDRFLIEKPDSPRIGFIPIVSTGDGADDWEQVNGTSRPVRVVDYVMVYIGHIGLPGEPAYVRGANCIPTPCVGNQLQVFVTPVRGMITPNFDYELLETWNASSIAPTAITLVD